MKESGENMRRRQSYGNAKILLRIQVQTNVHIRFIDIFIQNIIFYLEYLIFQFLTKIWLKRLGEHILFFIETVYIQLIQVVKQYFTITICNNI